MVLMGRALDLFRAYRTQLIGAAVTGGAVAVVVAGWQYYRAYQRDLAFQEYNQGLREYQAGRYDAALDAFRTLKDRGQAPYDTLADLYIANSYIALDQPGKAVEMLGGNVSGDADGFLTQVALVTLGLAQEMEGACEDAVQSLSRALDHQGPMRQEAMLGKARCNTRLGKTQDAVAGYKAYLKEFPEDETVGIALRLQRLEAGSGTPSEKAATP